ELEREAPERSDRRVLEQRVARPSGGSRLALGGRQLVDRGPGRAERALAPRRAASRVGAHHAAALLVRSAGAILDLLHLVAAFRVARARRADHVDEAEALGRLGLRVAELLEVVARGD